jgi:hypothetical protein
MDNVQTGVWTWRPDEEHGWVAACKPEEPYIGQKLVLKYTLNKTDNVDER